MCPKKGELYCEYLHPVGELEEQAREEARRLFQFANVKKALKHRKRFLRLRGFLEVVVSV